MDMALPRHRKLADKMVAAGSLGALLLGLAVLDERFRTTILGVLAADSSSDIAAVGVRAQRYVMSLIDTVGFGGSDHQPLVFFACAGLGLLLLMLRT
jgi:hypothetical protein